MSNYEVIEDYRKDSSAYTKRKDKDAKGIRYLRCTKFREGCPVRAKICLNSNVLSIIKEHENHDESESQIAVRKVLTKLKRRAEILKNRFGNFLMKRLTLGYLICMEALYHRLVNNIGIEPTSVHNSAHIL